MPSTTSTPPSVPAANCIIFRMCSVILHKRTLTNRDPLKLSLIFMVALVPRWLALPQWWWPLVMFQEVRTLFNFMDLIPVFFLQLLLHSVNPSTRNPKVMSVPNFSSYYVEPEEENFDPQKGRFFSTFLASNRTLILSSSLIWKPIGYLISILLWTQPIGIRALDLCPAWFQGGGIGICVCQQQYSSIRWTSTNAPIFIWQI